MACCVGNISGCHIDPAVSLGVLLSGGMYVGKNTFFLCRKRPQTFFDRLDRPSRCREGRFSLSKNHFILISN